MSQPPSVSMKAFLFAIFADIIIAVFILCATYQFEVSLVESLLLTLTTEILIVEVQSILLPAIALWGERRLIARGPSAVLSRGDRMKNEAKRFLYGVWCYSGYNIPELLEYFRKEKEIIKSGVKVHRLVNVGFVGKENVRKHCQDFINEVKDGKYILTAVNYHSREFLIADRKKALVLYQDLWSKDIGGGIGPYDDRNWVASYADEYEELEKSGSTLSIDPSDPGKSIDEWIDAAP